MKNRCGVQPGIQPFCQDEIIKAVQNQRSTVHSLPSNIGGQNMRPAIYLRTAAADPEQLKAQLMQCLLYLDQLGYTPVRIYVDYGRGGGDKDNPALLDMLSDAEQSVFNVLVLERLDRMSRSELRLIHYLEALHKEQVRVEQVQQAWTNNTL